MRQPLPNHLFECSVCMALLRTLLLFAAKCPQELLQSCSLICNSNRDWIWIEFSNHQAGDWHTKHNSIVNNCSRGNFRLASSDDSIGVPAFAKAHLSHPTKKQRDL